MEHQRQHEVLWTRLVSVQGADAEVAREGQFFNTLLVVSICVAACMALAFLVAGMRGLFTFPHQMGWGLAFSGGFIALSAFCLHQTRQGRVAEMLRLYIWANFLGTLGFCLLFNGYQSVGWLLFFWPVSLAGTFLEPGDAVRMAVGVLLSYGVVVIGELFDVYAPPIVLTLESIRFLALSFGFIMLVATAGVINYLNMLHQREALSQARHLTETLDETRRDLEQRVLARTGELQERADQLQTIAELSRATASILDMDDLLETTVHLISDRLGYYHAGIFLLDAAGDWAMLRVASSEGGEKMLARGHRLRVGGQGIVGYVAQTGIPRIASNVGEDAVWFNNPDLPLTQSEMALPLVARGQTIGVLDIQTQERSAFTEQDVDVLRVLADSIAIAIANTRSLQETRAALNRLARYQEQDTFMAWRQALARRTMRLDYRYMAGLVSEAQVEETMALDQADTLHEVTSVVDDAGLHLLLAPLRLQERTLGVLTFERPAPWSDDEIQLTQFVVEQLSLALDNARLLEQTRLAAQQERARSEIVASVRSLSTTDAILRTAAEELGRALKVERSRIQLLPPDENTAL